MMCDNANIILSSGNTGESIINDIMRQMGLRYYHNLYVEDRSDNISQIDFLALSNDTIVTLEVKNYNGCLIKGDSYSSYWTACYTSKNKSFYNPLKQNEKHIQVLRSCINNNSMRIFNFVVFVSGCVLKIVEPLSWNERVLTTSDLWNELVSVNMIQNDRVPSDIVDVLDDFQSRTFELSDKHRKKYFYKKG